MLQTNLEEYFKLKRLLKELRADLKAETENHDLTEEIKEINLKVKKLRKDLNADPVITDIKDEIDTNKERFDLLKDIIKQEMIDSEVETVEFEGRSINLVKVMKEGKQKDEKGKTGGGFDRTEIEIDENITAQ